MQKAFKSYHWWDDWEEKVRAVAVDVTFMIQDVSPYKVQARVFVNSYSWLCKMAHLCQILTWCINSDEGVDNANQHSQHLVQIAESNRLDNSWCVKMGHSLRATCYVVGVLKTMLLDSHVLGQVLQDKVLYCTCARFYVVLSSTSTKLAYGVLIQFIRVPLYQNIRWCGASRTTSQVLLW